MPLSTHYFIFFRWCLVFSLCATAMRVRSAYMQGLPLFEADYIHALSSGMLADMAVAAVMALLCAALSRVRFLVWLIAFLYAALLAGNAMFIDANGSNMVFSMAPEAANETFIVGVVLTAEYMLELLLAVLLLVLGTLLFRPSKWLIGLSAMYVAILLVMMVVVEPGDLVVSEWLESHMFVDNTRYIFAEPSSYEVSPENVDAFFLKDLDALPFVKYANPVRRPNVLIIAMESVGQRRINREWMPYLKSLRKKSLYYSQYVAASQVTSNGLYAMLCADHPNVLVPNVGSVKAWKMHKKKSDYACLPRLLQDHGYHSVFMQSATLKFQNKKRMSKAMGFAEAYGREDFLPIEEGESRWGKDDAKLYSRVLSKIDDIQKTQSPWLMTVLTVSTHHPSVVPDSYVRTQPPLKGKGRVSAYADMALEAFITSLEQRGYLDNTLVIITNDEVRTGGGKELRAKMRRNHGILFVLTPNQDIRQIDTIYGQTDIAISVLDYLGISSQHLNMGRSIFRHYVSFRPFFFTQFFSRHIMIVPDEQTVVACRRKELECHAYREKTNGEPVLFFQKDWQKTTWDELYKRMVISISKRNDKQYPPDLSGMKE